jgi:uncharacterized protein YigE (DUF2233 family)
LKAITVTFFSLFILALSIPSIGQEYKKSDTLQDNYKIIKINKVKNGYVIILYNEKFDLWYDLAALREKDKKYSRIVVGNTYDLCLIPYSEIDYVPNLGLTWLVEINTKKIPVKSNSWTGNVYTSPNLKGLYYVDNIENLKQTRKHYRRKANWKNSVN